MPYLRLLLVLIFIAPISAYADDNPVTTAELTEHFKDYTGFGYSFEKHPANYDVREAQIVASESVGTALNPRIKYKIKTEIELLDDLYKPILKVGDYSIVVPNERAPKGTVSTYYWLIDAHVVGERWVLSNFEDTHVEGSEIRDGYPLSYWKDNKGALEGTPLAVALREKLERQQQAQAYEEKLRAELVEERRQLIAAKQKSKEDAVSDRRNAWLGEYRERMPGTWVAHEPINGSRLGGPFREGGHTYRYVISFPENDDLEGIADITFFAHDNPDLKVTFTGKYTVRVGGNNSRYVTLAEDYGHKLPANIAPQWVSGNAWNISVYENGTIIGQGSDGKTFKLYKKR